MHVFHKELTLRKYKFIIQKKMKKYYSIFAVLTALISSCNMQNPLLSESTLPYGAPLFDQIENKHYLPAFEKAIAEYKSEIDAIVNNPDTPTFVNTIEALEYSGKSLEKVSNIFFNLLEANTNDEMQDIAEKISPMITEMDMYINLNETLFKRVKTVYENPDTSNLEYDKKKLLNNTYKSFARNGANLSKEDKEIYSKYVEQLSLLSLQFSKNVLDATNAYQMVLTDESDLDGLPDYLRSQAADAAKAKDTIGWLIDLSAPSYGPFMKFSTRRDLREKIYRAYNTKAVGGEFDNSEIIKQIVNLRIKVAHILGYSTFAQYQTEERMVKSPKAVHEFLNSLLEPALPIAKKEVEELNAYAKSKGLEGNEIMPWDFSFWAEKLRVEKYDLSEEQLKPYFNLDCCIKAVFNLANSLYGITFTEMSELPVYHPDVKVYDVKDADGRHLSLFYADFFPRESKRGGAWMTEFKGQKIINRVEERPFISIVTNFTKPTTDTPSLITHDEFTTFLHEFGHALQGIMAEGRYGSLTGTNVDHDFVELPSQIMENWAYEPEYLNTFAKHYQTGEVIPQELIDKIVASKNYLSAYYHIRQLQYGLLDMAWYDINEVPTEYVIDYEKKALSSTNVLPSIPECASSHAFSHIFAGGYSAGYYSYKWAEVLSADAYSLFKEKGIFNNEVSSSFRKLLSAGGSIDAAKLYKDFRGHNPEPEALLRQLDIIK